MEQVIEVRDLVKVYKDGTQALRGVTFAVRTGEFFGFLGPNGAGKTTTIKIITTLLPRTSGTARVLGYDVAAQPNEVRARIGYAAQEVGVDDELTGRENLLLQGRLYHVPDRLLKARLDELLAILDLTADAARPAGSYSGGMRKRLDLATGLIHRPQVLFLDEPTTGLDPQTRANLWVYLEKLNKREGLTIFLTTHYMEEADRLCDRVGIIDHGTLAALDTPATLKDALGGDVITLTFAPNGGDAAARLAQAATVVQSIPGVTSADPFDEGLNVYTPEGARTVPALVRALADQGLPIDKLSLTRPTLDDVFLKYTGRKIRDEAPPPNWRARRLFGGRGGRGRVVG